MFFLEDEILSKWIGDDFRIILQNYDHDDLNRLDTLINHDLARRTNFPFFKFNEDDDTYIKIFNDVYNSLTTESKEINKFSWEYREATHSAKQKYFYIKNKNYTKNFIFKNEIIDNQGQVKYFKTVSCYVWKKLEESPYGEEWERRTLNKCFGDNFEDYNEVDFECNLIHLVFSNTEIDSNLISSDNIVDFNNYIDELSNVDEVIIEYAVENNLKGLHLKKLLYNYSGTVELFIPKFEDINIDEYEKDSELYQLKSSLDLDKPKIGEQKRTSRKCIFEGCNVYLNPLNTGFLCKKHLEMNIDKKNEYRNPDSVSPLFREYLDVHFNVLDKIRIKHPGVWSLLSSEIMNTLFLDRGGVGSLLQYKINNFYNEIMPFIRWYLREEIVNKLNISHLSSELKISTIRIEGILSNLQIDYWENEKIKNNCVVPKQIENSLLVKNEACKSKKKIVKYLYRDVETASLFLREGQEIYQCPKSIGFHIKSIH